MKQNITREKCPDCSIGNEEYCARNHDPVKGMKQNITPSQLNELSDKGTKKLQQWWLKTYHENELSEWMIRYEDKWPLITIGQMIEFLGDRSHGVLRNYPHPDYADALWESVKEVLK